MKTPIMTLAVLLGVAAGAIVGSEAAWAAMPSHHHHHAARPMLRHGLKSVAFHRLAAPMSPQGAVVERAAYVEDETGAPSDHPGVFKTHDTAGWGVSQGGGQAAVGFYKRPEETGVPAPQMYQNEGRGAAGLSFTMKLGG